MGFNVLDVRDYSLVPKGKASSGDMSSLVPRWLGNESSPGDMSSLVPRWLGNESSPGDMSSLVPRMVWE